MASLGLPHWLMIGGLLLVLAGFAGLMLTRNTKGEEDSTSVAGAIDATEPLAAEETGEYESRAVTTSRKLRPQQRRTPATTNAGHSESSGE